MCHTVYCTVLEIVLSAFPVLRMCIDISSKFWCLKSVKAKYRNTHTHRRVPDASLVSLNNNAQVVVYIPCVSEMSERFDFFFFFRN